MPGLKIRSVFEIIENKHIVVYRYNLFPEDPLD